mmetsp:Transcript_75043/g.174023  ORF Transcript_75043/g.174023 Transcript_75043/m.174023 type:complete len:296 (-) Transcript_75043:86-973(-)|eukprot:CAMPEP_0171106156 /NCGR_PEP_ID=MMETSP0766_2-20121228/64161_1 /TAXON_ID=439317 /ORGANISM="Gambierdiscus australes, Strain CAWD 149" /LENGTH=295 /DNA_ID=CAMNT_0011567175 /DNA_START=30 /DNA_END=917 /DNA_ORIENTATION=+
MSSSFYTVIGVSNVASQKEIAKAFRAKARVVHPDKLPPTATEAAKLQAKTAFQELVRAYEVLSDAKKRSQYDASLPKPDSRESPQNTARAQNRAGDGNGRARAPSSKGGTCSTATGGGTAGREGNYRAGGQYQPRGADSDWHHQADQADRERDRQRNQADEAARERERQLRKEGLGSHWVKPPKPTSSDRGQWEGWKNSGVAGRGYAPKDDSDSDTSSVLSFNIGIDLNNLNLDDLEMMSDDDPLGFADGEVWKIREPPKDTEPIGQIPAGGNRPRGSADQRSRQQPVRPCCATQ